MRITKQSHPAIHATFELISHDRGTQAGHESYYVPPIYDKVLDIFEKQLASIKENADSDWECFCIGDVDEADLIMASYGLEDCHKFLNDFFSEWIG